MIPVSGIAGIDWLDAVRASAWSVYHRMPPPDRSVPLWRYTDPELFGLPDGPPVDSADGGPEVETDAPTRAAGVTNSPLVTAARDREDRVRPRLGTLIGIGFGRPEALNSAIWSAGSFLHVPKGAIVDSPVRIRTRLGTARTFRAHRHLIVVEEGARVSIIDDLTDDEAGGPTSYNGVTEIFAGPNSRVQYLALHHLGLDTVAHRTVRTHLDRHAQADMRTVSLGGGIDKLDIGVILAGEGSRSRIQGLCFADQRQKADLHTVHDHIAPRTFSDIDFRVVLTGRARSAYTGLIRIAKDAPHCEAYQENRNLLLSDHARADTIPELEILTDEVRCKHGATVGPIDPEQLYYLGTRGLDPMEATQTIVSGFLRATLEGLPATTREPADRELLRRLEGVLRKG